MKILIAGGRDFKSNEIYENFLCASLRFLNCTEVVSGGAKGADAFGEFCAKKLGIPVKRFDADWEEYGRMAGPIRNKQMAEYCDKVILLKGGNGTDSMRNEARLAGKPIIYDEKDYE